MEDTQLLECTQDLGELTQSNIDSTIIGWLHIGSQRHALYFGDTKIGRDPSLCKIVLDGEKTISKEHALIEAEKSLVTVTDLGSRNKSRIESKILKPHVRYAVENRQNLRFGAVKATYIKEDEISDTESDMSDSLFQAPVTYKGKKKISISSEDERSFLSPTPQVSSSTVQISERIFSPSDFDPVFVPETPPQISSKPEKSTNGIFEKDINKVVPNSEYVVPDSQYTPGQLCDEIVSNNTKIQPKKIPFSHFSSELVNTTSDSKTSSGSETAFFSAMENTVIPNDKIVENDESDAPTQVFNYDEVMKKDDDVFSAPTQEFLNRFENVLSPTNKDLHIENSTSDQSNNFRVKKRLSSETQEVLNAFGDDCNKTLDLETQEIISAFNASSDDSLNDSTLAEQTQVINCDNLFKIPKTVPLKSKKKVSFPEGDIFDAPTQVFRPKDLDNSFGQNNSTISDVDDIFIAPTQIPIERKRKNNNFDSDKKNKCMRSDNYVCDDIFDAPTQVFSVPEKKSNEPDEIFDAPTQVFNYDVKAQDANIDSDIFSAPTQVFDAKKYSDQSTINSQNYLPKTRNPNLIKKSSNLVVKDITENENANISDDTQALLEAFEPENDKNIGNVSVRSETQEIIDAFEDEVLNPVLLKKEISSSFKDPNKNENRSTDSKCEAKKNENVFDAPTQIFNWNEGNSENDSNNSTDNIFDAPTQAFIMSNNTSEKETGDKNELDTTDDEEETQKFDDLEELVVNYKNEPKNYESKLENSAETIENKPENSGQNNKNKTKNLEENDAENDAYNESTQVYDMDTQIYDLDEENKEFVDKHKSQLAEKFEKKNEITEKIEKEDENTADSSSDIEELTQKINYDFSNEKENDAGAKHKLDDKKRTIENEQYCIGEQSDINKNGDKTEAKIRDKITAEKGDHSIVVGNSRVTSEVLARGYNDNSIESDTESNGSETLLRNLDDFLPSDSTVEKKRDENENSVLSTQENVQSADDQQSIENKDEETQTSTHPSSNSKSLKSDSDPTKIPSSTRALIPDSDDEIDYPNDTEENLKEMGFTYSCLQILPTDTCSMPVVDTQALLQTKMCVNFDSSTPEFQNKKKNRFSNNQINKGENEFETENFSPVKCSSDVQNSMILFDVSDQSETEDVADAKPTDNISDFTGFSGKNIKTANFDTKNQISSTASSNCFKKTKSNTTASSSSKSEEIKISFETEKRKERSVFQDESTSPSKISCRQTQNSITDSQIARTIDSIPPERKKRPRLCQEVEGNSTNSKNIKTEKVSTSSKKRKTENATGSKRGNTENATSSKKMETEISKSSKRIKTENHESKRLDNSLMEENKTGGRKNTRNNKKKSERLALNAEESEANKSRTKDNSQLRSRPSFSDDIIETNLVENACDKEVNMVKKAKRTVRKKESTKTNERKTNEKRTKGKTIKNSFNKDEEICENEIITAKVNSRNRNKKVGIKNEDVINISIGETIKASKSRNKSTSTNPRKMSTSIINLSVDSNAETPRRSSRMKKKPNRYDDLNFMSNKK